MTVTLDARTARRGLACWLAVAGWLAAGCSHHSETSASPGGEGAPQQSATVPAQPSGTATALPPGAGPSGTSGGVAGQPPAGGGPAAGGSAGASGSTAAPGAPGAPAGGTRLPRMPNLVGRNLQDAQDALQAAGVVFYSTSHDATGQHRPQLLDLTWKVCSQTPAAGHLVPKNVVPDFGVVQLDESCP